MNTREKAKPKSVEAEKMGQLVKDYRDALGLTNNDIAAKVYGDETRSSSVSDLISGRYNPTAETRARYREALDIPQDRIDAIYRPSPTTRVILVIDADFDTFSEADRENLRIAVDAVLNISGSEIKNITEGSVIVELEIPLSKKRELQIAIAKGRLKSRGVLLILPRADLRGVDLRGVDLREANLREANLRGANLWEANLRGANLWGASLWGASLWGANLQGANLQGANLQGANLQGANLWGVDLQEADLQGADLQKANLWGAILQKAILLRADLSMPI